MSWIDPKSKLRDLLKIAEGIVEEDRKREAEEVRLAAELKAKQEAEAKAAAELKAKQEAEAKAAAELKAKQEADAKAAAELKAKQEADARAAALKKTTLTCVKGKLTKKVTAFKPKCPSGYKLKK
jgi:membrane protein involved in colicin uptake